MRDEAAERPTITKTPLTPHGSMDRPLQPRSDAYTITIQRLRFILLAAQRPSLCLHRGGLLKRILLPVELFDLCHLEERHRNTARDPVLAASPFFNTP